MPSPEQKIGNAVENQAPEIKISYALTDRYGRVYRSGDTFELGEIPPGATEFDGYIESPYGNFAYQGSLKLVIPILREIKEHFELSKKLTELRSKLKEAREEQYWAAEKWRRTNEGEPYARAREKVVPLEREVYRAEYDLRQLNESLAPHRI